MKISPFIYGKTVSVNSFTNREVEVKKLFDNLTNGVNTMIISPRRWGKSSLVEKVVSEIKAKNKDIKIVVMDLFAAGCEEEFLEIFAREVIKASSSKWQEWAKIGKDLFKTLLPKISIGIDPVNDFNISFDWHELKKYSDEVLNLPETIANKKGSKFVICLDEFQNIASFNDYDILEKKMRAVWQRQKSVTYCLFGSKRHMMSEIFNNSTRPFFRFGDMMLLPKIEISKWIPFITKGFADTGKQISEDNAKEISLIMKNHSWYVQQLAHYTWNLTTKIATTKTINQALNELIYANTPFYQKEIESISTTQLNFLKAVLKKNTQFTSSRIMQKYHLGTPRNVSKNKVILINNDFIQDINGSLEFVDPAFELWFNKQYFNISYNV